MMEKSTDLVFLFPKKRTGLRPCAVTGDAASIESACVLWMCSAAARRRSLRWKRYGNPGADLFPAKNLETAAVPVDDPFGDGKAQAGAAVFPIAGRVRAEEPLEHVRNVFL